MYLIHKLTGKQLSRNYLSQDKLLLFAFLLESPLYFEIGEPSHDEEQRCIDLLEILVIAPGHADHLPAQKTITIRAKKSCQRDSL